VDYTVAKRLGRDGNSASTKRHPCQPIFSSCHFFPATLFFYESVFFKKNSAFVNPAQTVEAVVTIRTIEYLL